MMLEASCKAVANGGKIIFSGCGATGRLSILLESMWRTFFRRLEAFDPNVFRKVARFENTVFSIMTGGDYALIKSVESFEDYPQFGRRQAEETRAEFTRRPDRHYRGGRNFIGDRLGKRGGQGRGGGCF